MGGCKLKVVETEGSPREMGRQYGEQARDEIRRNAELWGRTAEPADAAYMDMARDTLSSRVPEVSPRITRSSLLHSDLRSL